MKPQILPLIFLFLLLLGIDVQAQDPVFSQLTGQPLYLNPAYTGATRAYRFTTNFRSQWFSGNTPGFHTGTASFDMFSNAGLGLGLMVMNDQQGVAGLNTQQFSLLVSYEVAFNNDSRLRFGLQAGAAQRSVNTNRLVFGNQLGPFGPVGGMGDPLLTNLRPQPYEDIGLGMIYGHNSFSFGMALHHITRPEEYSFDFSERQPMKITLHAGKEILLKGDVNSIQLLAAQRMQGPHNQLDAGAQLYFMTHMGRNELSEQLFVGAFYRGLTFTGNGTRASSDAIAFTTGYVMVQEYSILTVGLSYDVVVSQLGLNNTAGTGEISISYAFKNRSGDKSEPVPMLKSRGRCEDYLRWPNRKYNHTMLVPKAEKGQFREKRKSKAGKMQTPPHKSRTKDRPQTDN